MKRLISSFSLIFICLLALVLPISTNKVSAIEITNNPANSIVYYQGVVRANSGKYVSFNAVSQYYYTDRNLLGVTEAGDNKVPITGRSKENFTNLVDLESEKSDKKDESSSDKKVESSPVCSLAGSQLICSDNKLLGYLSTLKINAQGDVFIELANEVRITNLRIYYILANKVESNHLYCGEQNSSVQICDNAITVQKNDKNFTNWKNQTQDGSTMVYSESTIKTKFKELEKEGGSKIYSGFNIFDEMVQTYAQLAEASGVYVLVSYAISYNDVDYYVNNYSVNDKTFSKEVGNLSTDAKYNQLIVYSDASNRADISGIAITNVARNAALIKPASTRDINQNNGFALMEGFFEETLRPILIIAIGVLFVIVGTHTGVTIVKSSDEPEVRSAAIKKFIGLFVGAFIIMMILIFYKDIITAIQRFF